MIKAVIFDFGGVLASEGFQDYISAHIAPYADIEQEISDMEREVNSGNLPVKIYDDFLAVMSGGNPKEIDKEIVAGYIVHHEMLRIVQQLHIMGIMTAILSNFPNEWFSKLRKRFHLDNFFDLIVVSSLEHLVKPEKEIFEKILQELHCKPEEAVFIDDRASYTDTASKIGIHGLTFISPEQLKNDLHQLTNLSF